MTPSLQVFVDDEEDTGITELQRYAASPGSKGAAHREAEESQIKVGRVAWFWLHYLVTAVLIPSFLLISIEDLLWGSL